MASSLGLILGAAAFTAAVQADPFGQPAGYHRYVPQINGINWAPCKANPERDCALFEVPRDWHNETAGKATLAVARHRATKEPKLGTLFINPGGPGGSGVDTITGSVNNLVAATDGRYDLVGWDPRGLGLTVPRADCFATAAEENAFWEGTVPRAGLEALGNLTNQRDLEAFYAQVPEVDQLLIQLGKKCVEYSPNTFQYVGSAAAVRDMVAMHDILEGPEKPVDYWGFSYGTIIGVYFVNMFPNRVGRVVLDGVIDPVYWANRPPHELWGISVESTDEAFTGFVSACALAGPTGCAIATNNSTPDSLRQWTLDLLDAAYNYKQVVGPTANVTFSTTRDKIFGAMYSPTRWPGLAQELYDIDIFLRSQNTTQRAKRSTISKSSVLKDRQSEAASDYSFQAVTCADAIDAGNVTTKDVFDFLVKVTQEPLLFVLSGIVGPTWGDAGFYCHHWPVRAVERYTGPWNKTLSNPILVIGNEADPITPYISAKRVADALGDSAILLEQDDYGHVSLAMHSSCTTDVLKKYFLDNELPPRDNLLCGTNQQLFPGPGITKNTLAALSAPGYGSGNNTDLNAELEAARQRSRNLLITVIVQAAALVLVILGLTFSWVRNRKSKSGHATYIPRGVFEKAAEGQGHTYDNPFNPITSSEKGGYSRVET